MNRSTVAQTISTTKRNNLGMFLSGLLLDASTADRPKNINQGSDGWEIIGDTNEGDDIIEESPTLNFNSVHRVMIPGVWHQVQLNSFPTNWVVLRFVKGSTTELEIYAHGDGGLEAATQRLSPSHVSFLALRVSTFNILNGISLSKPGAIGNVFATLIHIPADAPIKHRQNAHRNRSVVKSYFHDSDIYLEIHQDRASKLAAKTVHQEVRQILEENVLEYLQSEFDEMKPMVLLPENEFCTKECYHYDSADGTYANAPFTPPSAPPPLQHKPASSSSSSNKQNTPSSPVSRAIAQAKSEYVEHERRRRSKVNSDRERLRAKVFDRVVNTTGRALFDPSFETKSNSSNRVETKESS